MGNSPAEHTKNQIHDEKGTEDNHRDEVEELPGVTHGVLDL